MKPNSLVGDKGREFLHFNRAGAGESTALGAAERNVDDGLEIDGLAFLGGGLEFPLRESLYGVGVKLRVDAAHKLNAVHGAILANHAVEDHFSLHVILDHRLRILGVNLVQGHRRVDFAKTVRTAPKVQFREVDDPTARGAV